MKLAGYALLLSAVLHVIGAGLAGFAGGTMPLLIIGILFVVLFAGLMRGLPGVAYLSFVGVLIGIAAAVAGYFGPTPVPGWVYLAILAADTVAAILLFGAIWSGPRARRLGH